MTDLIIWDIDLSSLVGKKVEVWTTIGGRSTGTVTRFDYRAITIGEETCPIPDKMVVDNTEQLSFKNISKIVLWPQE